MNSFRRIRPAVAASQWNELAGEKFLFADLAAALANAHEHLLVALAHGNDQLTAFRELRHQRLRNPWCRGGNQNAIERRSLRPAQRSVADFDPHTAVSQR